MYESACRYREAQWLSDTQYNVIIILVPRMYNITVATRKSKPFNERKIIRLQTELKYPSKNRRRFTQRYNMTKIIFS